MYETYIIETNLVYKLVDDRLQLADEYSGTILKHGMLRSKEVTPLLYTVVQGCSYRDNLYHSLFALVT